MTIKGDIEMTATYYDVKQVYARNYGSDRLYKRNYCNNLYYTTGIMDFAETLNAHWLIDTVVSYMPKVIEEYKKSEETFFLIEVRLNQKQEGYFEIFREGWIGDEYHAMGIYSNYKEYTNSVISEEDMLLNEIYEKFVEM